MKLELDPDVLKNHQQKKSNSCIPMSVELLLKLNGNVKPTFFDIQDGNLGYKTYDGDGWEYKDKTIEGMKLHHLFEDKRGKYPIEKLFDKIREELDNKRFVQISLYNGKRNNGKDDNYHGWVVYGYEQNPDKFYGITFDHGNPNPVYKDTVFEELTKMKGTDILVYE